MRPEVLIILGTDHFIYESIVARYAIVIYSYFN
jgi:hypothetical protein